MEIARRIRAGATSVNAVLGFAAVAALPFGGVGASGSAASTARRACRSSADRTR
ncbi:hypothetical protein [Saccharopolyspora gregorii]|uniref:hypothetical protein n=1 Tax=Saccharopolyspora gregorii TaxID=33914 RepID=UPI0031ECFD42